MDTIETINEILDYFQKSETDPGGDWAFPDDYSSLCLDFRGKRDGAVFWLDIERDGRIKLLWRPDERPARSITFKAITEQS